MTSATLPGRALRALRLPLAFAALLAFAVLPAAAQDGGVEAEGPIEALGAASLTVDGYTFDVTSATRITDDDDRPFPFDSLEVGLEVGVEGVERPDGSLLALEIQVNDDDGGDGEPESVEAEGPIEALGAASLTVDGRTFDVTSATRITGDDDRPFPFDSLEVGLEVSVEGVERPDGSLLALEIEVDDDDGDYEGIEAEGLVTARTDSTLSVAGLTFAVTAATRVTGDDGRPIPYSDITVGRRVEVRGAVGASGTLVALEIHLEDDGDDPDDHGGIEVEGLIQYVSADSLQVRNRTFVLTDSTVIVGDDDAPFPAGSLAVGLRVEVYGRYVGGVLVALRVEVEDPRENEEEVELLGAIEALSAAGLTVSGTEFAVTPQTLVLDARRQQIPFAALVLGQVVEVHGRTLGGVLVATRIKVEDGDLYEQEVGVRAALDAVGDSVAVVLGRPFLVYPFTRILGPDRTPVALADLPIGGVVEIHARRDADGQLVAYRIETEDDDPATISLRATVTAVSADSVGVLGVAFAAGTAVVVNRDGSPATLADVLVGQGVRLTGVRSADGGFTATRIEIRRSAQAMGRVATTQAGRLGLAGVAVTYTAETLFVTEAGAAVPASSIAAGASVLAFGTTTAAGTLDATRVVVLDAATTVATSGTPGDARLAIERVFPNPTTGTAVVRYAVATAAAVQMTVVDALGRTVLTAVDGQVAAGTHEARLDASRLPAGLYIVRLSVDGRAAGARTLTVVR